MRHRHRWLIPDGILHLIAGLLQLVHQGILSRSQMYISHSIVQRANELSQIGITNLDALHIACAEQAQAVFLTTDDGIINTMTRSNLIRTIVIANPIPWLEEVIHIL